MTWNDLSLWVLIGLVWGLTSSNRIITVLGTVSTILIVWILFF